MLRFDRRVRPILFAGLMAALLAPSVGQIRAQESTAATPEAVGSAALLVQARGSDSSAPLPGACYRVFDAGQISAVTAVVCDGDDGADGIASFAGLTAGDLTVVQTTAPDGYLLARPISVHVSPGVPTDVVVINDPIPAQTSTPTEAATKAPTSTPMPTVIETPMQTPTAASMQTTVHTKAPTHTAPVSSAATAEFGAGEGALLVKTVDGAGDPVNECIALQHFPHAEDFYSIVCDNQYYRFPVGNRLVRFQHLDPDVRIGYVEATALPAGDYDLLSYFGQTFQSKKVTIVAGAVTRITVVTGIGGGLAVFVANPDGSPYLGGFCVFIHDEFGTSYDVGQGGCDGDRSYDQHDDRWYDKDGEIAHPLTVGDYVVVVSDANHGVVKPIRHVTVPPGREQTVVAVTFGTAAVTMEFADPAGRSISGGCIRLTQSNPELAPIQAGHPELADFTIGGTRNACLESGRTVTGLAPGDYTVQTLSSPAGFSMPAQPLPFTIAEGQQEVVSIRPDGLHTGTATPTPTATPSPTPTATPASKPDVSLQAPSGKVGANLAVTLTHFPADTTATVKIAGRTLGTVAIAGNGSGAATFRIPSLTGGRHTVVATDGAIKATRSLTVSPAQSLSPGTVKAGASVTVSVTGFGANATLSVRLYKPNGSPDYRIVGTIHTDKSGAGHLTVSLPASTPTGKRRLATYGPESHASGYVTVAAP